MVVCPDGGIHPRQLRQGEDEAKGPATDDPHRPKSSASRSPTGRRALRSRRKETSAAGERHKGVIVWGVGLAVLAFAIGAILARPVVFAHLSDLAFDGYQRLKPREEAEAPIVVVDIDEASLAKIGQWPWPRTTIATLVDRLGRMGAAAIAFDMVFPEPDRTSPSRVIAALRKEGARIDLPAGEAELDNDAALAAAFARNRVVAGIAISNENGNALPPAKAGFAFGGESPKDYLPAFSGGVANLPELTSAAAGVGFFSFPLSGDGVVRSLPLLARSGGNIYPALSIEALRVAQDAGSFIIRSTGASGEANTGRPAMTALKDGAFAMPTGPDGSFRVYYSGMPRMKTISAADILDPGKATPPEQEISGHIVLVGTSAVGLRDLVATPFRQAMPGVRVHAEIIDQIMGQSFLTRPDWARGAEIALAAGLGLLLLLLEWRFGAVVNSIAALSGIATVIGLSWAAFSGERLLIDPILPAMAVALVFAVTTPALLLLANRERRFIQSAFGRYLSPALVGRLADNPAELKLGGEVRDLTVLFSDIRGFTTLSEKLDPSELTSLLNGFLTPATDVLLRADATIDKYIGDAIMAFWNAPLDIPDHRRKACLAALAMRHALDELNRARGLDLRIGIGLHSGECCVGNLGSAQRFSYSAIGDSVNLASRIEGLTKQYGVDILMTEETIEGAGDLAFIEADRVRVVGREHPVRIFALIGDAADARSEAFRAFRQAHESFLDAYRRGDFESAPGALANASAAAPEPAGGLYRVYEDRLAALAKAPPEPGWDGVFVADRK
jgi:adenylate cyclase